MAQVRKYGSSLKRLRKAKPPRSIQKQQLSDMEKRISMQIGNFLVLIEEGTPVQISMAKQRARSELLKIGPDMEKTAQSISSKMSMIVREFLDSIDSILHSGTDSSWIDEAKITRCFNATQKLEKALA